MGLVNPNPSPACSNDCDGRLIYLDGTAYALPSPNYFFGDVESNSGDKCHVIEESGTIDDRPCTGSRPFTCQFDCTLSAPQLLSGEATCPNGVSVPSGYFDAGGKLYKYVSTVQRWQQAYDACHADNARLATIANEQDYNTIMSISAMTGQLLWIGLRNNLNASCGPTMTDCMGQVSWVDGTGVNDDSFYTDIVSLTNNHCNGLSSNRQIMGSSCMSSYAFICQFDCPTSCPDPPGQPTNGGTLWDSQPKITGQTVS